MKLDIIIPHYKEPWSVCRYLFDTLAVQRGVNLEDIRVIFVNDGKHDECNLSLEDLEKTQLYPFEVDVFFKEHAGISAARNFGLYQSDTDYVMFCDADDGFLNGYGLYVLMEAAKDKPDLIVSDFWEETRDINGDVAVVKHDQDLTFMHGKLYRREFLLEHDLVFDESMTIHEDGYFNMIVYATAQHEGVIKPVNAATYLWRWNDNSTVRHHKGNFVLKTYEEMIQVRTGICRQLKQRGYEDDFKTAVAMTVVNSFYDFNKPDYGKEKYREYALRAERAFKAFWDEYKGVFMEFDNSDIAKFARVSRENAYKNGFLYERFGLQAWLKHIEYEVN